MSTHNHPMKTRSMTRSSESKSSLSLDQNLLSKKISYIRQSKNQNQSQDKRQDKRQGQAKSNSVLSLNQAFNQVVTENWFKYYLTDMLSKANDIKLSGVSDIPLRELIHSKVSIVHNIYFMLGFYLNEEILGENFSTEWEKFLELLESKRLIFIYQLQTICNEHSTDLLKADQMYIRGVKEFLQNANYSIYKKK